MPGPIDVIGASGGGVMHEDLREACLRALKPPRELVRQRAEAFSWSAATDQILSALQRIQEPQQALIRRLPEAAAQIVTPLVGIPLAPRLPRWCGFRVYQYRKQQSIFC